MKKLRILLLLAVVILSSRTAMAGWVSSPEKIANHPTWIYMPGTTLKNSQSHGLMVVLHGCYQKSDALKNYGNLENAAEENGLVIAIPSVGDDYFAEWLLDSKCWDYDYASDNSGNVYDIVNITKQLLSRANLQIDKKHVYVVGLSSGAALALVLGCQAPDLFAGIGAVAGPSVGSSQWNATEDASHITYGNVCNAISVCENLAGGKAGFFKSQIANIAYGDMDKDGPKAKYPASSSTDSSHPGQESAVSTKWSKHNVRVLQEIYGADDLCPTGSVQDGKGDEHHGVDNNGVTCLSLLVVHDVGHAWPAGTGKPNSANSGGQWIAQQGLNYPEYIVKWLLAHSRR